MDGGLGTGIHGAEADGCHRRHYAGQRQWMGCVRGDFPQEVSVFFVDPLGDGIRIVHEDPVCPFAAKRGVDIFVQTGVGWCSLGRRFNAHCQGKGSTEGIQRMFVVMIYHKWQLLL